MYTPEEVAAIEKDIRDGIKGIIQQLTHQQMALSRIAMPRLNTNATSTRKLEDAFRKLVVAREAFEDVLEWDIKVRNSR